MSAITCEADFNRTITIPEVVAFAMVAVRKTQAGSIGQVRRIR